MNVGDTVRVSGGADKYHGQVGRIVKLDDNLRVATIKSPSSGYTFSVAIDFLEPYEYGDEDYE